MLKALWVVTVGMLVLGLSNAGCAGNDGGSGPQPVTVVRAGSGGLGGTGGVAGTTNAGSSGSSGVVSVGSSGTGGTGGTTGVSGTSGGVAGTSAPVMMTSVPCGTGTCGGLAPGMSSGASAFLPMACCLNPAMNMCGVSMAGGACMAPPPTSVPDPSCPPLMGLPVPAGGCCINGMCGVDLSILMMGCVENGAAATIAGASPLPLMVPPPKPCGADAGI